VESERELLVALGVAISKIVMYICFTIVLCTWIGSCQLEESDVSSCEDSCESFGSHMESVTSRECVCASKKSISSDDSTWVLPKK